MDLSEEVVFVAHVGTGAAVHDLVTVDVERKRGEDMIDEMC